MLEAAFARLAALAPDVLVLGGDYVSLEVTPLMGELLERLVAGVPAAVKVAVLGNHDLWTDHTIVERALVRAGATVLVNAQHPLAAATRRRRAGRARRSVDGDARRRCGVRRHGRRTACASRSCTRPRATRSCAIAAPR